jgi:hypothetical protein
VILSLVTEERVLAIKLVRRELFIHCWGAKSTVCKSQLELATDVAVEGGTVDPRLNGNSPESVLRCRSVWFDDDFTEISRDNVARAR